MSRRITVIRIDPASTAKVISLTVGALVAFALLIHFAAVAVGLGPVFTAGFEGAVSIIAVVPFIYMLGAYIAAWVFCLLLNFASRIFGGIRIDYSSE